MQYFYESDENLFASLRKKLIDDLSIKTTDNDPFARLVLNYMRKHSAEKLFLMPSEFADKIFNSFYN